MIALGKLVNISMHVMAMFKPLEQPERRTQGALLMLIISL